MAWLHLYTNRDLSPSLPPLAFESWRQVKIRGCSSSFCSLLLTRPAVDMCMYYCVLSMCSEHALIWVSRKISYSASAPLGQWVDLVQQSLVSLLVLLTLKITLLRKKKNCTPTPRPLPHPHNFSRVARKLQVAQTGDAPVPLNPQELSYLLIHWRLSTELQSTVTCCGTRALVWIASYTS